jgi:ribosome-associated protein
MAVGRPIGDLHVSAAVVIPAAELQWRFSRSSGPGGQNVNKVETAVELGFDLEGTGAIGPFQKQRLLERLGSRCVAGCLRVAVSEHRSQYQNRQLAMQRLGDLLREGLKPPPKLRKPTKPTRGAVKRRVDAKKQKSQVKQARQRRASMDE